MRIVKVILNGLSLVLLTASINKEVYSQATRPDKADLNRSNEKLLITTDREFYITGEQVLLKIIKMNGSTGIPSAMSKLIYVEMLDRGNRPVIQKKILADGITGSGSFIIPDTISSGNYIIRSYTRWMLNFSDMFSYKAISVVNPYKDFSDLVKDSGNAKGSENEITNPEKPAEAAIIFAVKSDKPQYLCRGKVRLDISTDNPAPDTEGTYLSVSVVKSYLSGSGISVQTETDANTYGISSLKEDSLLLPELEGEIISGTIRDKQTNEPLANTAISLCIVGKYSNCRFGSTNWNGEFRFPLGRLYGLHEIVIQPLLRYSNGTYVELDQPFSSSFENIRLPALNIDSIMAGQLNNSIIAMQVLKQYDRENRKETDTNEGNRFDFFGVPDKRVMLSDYIELTNVREVVKEILPEVSVTGRDENARLRITYRNPFGKFESPAFVMVDGIPVYNIGALLEVPCRDMERIDIINVRYFYSSFIFDGIISFVTKKGNLSALGYDDSVFRQVFEGCTEPGGFTSPSYDTDSLKLSRIPDFRNTLYWNPELRPGKDGRAHAEFYTSDEPGEYVVVISGITSSGKPVSGKGSFRVN